MKVIPHIHAQVSKDVNSFEIILTKDSMWWSCLEWAPNFSYIFFQLKKAQWRVAQSQVLAQVDEKKVDKVRSIPHLFPCCRPKREMTGIYQRSMTSSWIRWNFSSQQTLSLGTWNWKNRFLSLLSGDQNEHENYYLGDLFEWAYLSSMQGRLEIRRNFLTLPSLLFILYVFRGFRY